jgi:Glyoxalase-like domain
MSGQVDHLVYAVPDLDRAVEDLEKRLGVRAAPGGRHPGEGSRNALIGLGTGCYLEIVAPDPDQPLPSRPLWLGLEGRKTPRLTAWAVKGRDLQALVHRAQQSGVRLGPVETGSRRRPDGVVLRWEFTDPHAVVAEGLVPFFIDWSSSDHPATAAPAGVSLLALRAEHPRPAGVMALLRGLGLQLPVTKGDRAALIAHLDTPQGVVELR